MNGEKMQCCPLCRAQLFLKQEKNDHIRECEIFKNIEPIQKNILRKKSRVVDQPLVFALNPEKFIVTNFLIIGKKGE